MYDFVILLTLGTYLYCNFCQNVFVDILIHTLQNMVQHMLFEYKLFLDPGCLYLRYWNLL